MFDDIDTSFILRIVKVVGIGMAVLIAVMLTFGGFFTVDEGEQAVMLRNGALIGTAGPGLNFKLPVIDDAVILSTRTNKVSFDKVQAYSRDQQTAELRLSVNYRYVPSDVGRIYASFGQNGFEARILSPRVQEQVKTMFSGFNAVSAIQDRARLNLEVEDAIRKSIEGHGVVIESVQIENIDFSDAYEQSIEARMQAEVEVAKLKQQLDQDRVNADRTRAVAQGQADATRAKAQADSDAIRLHGDAEALAIAAKGKALADHPELVRLIQAERWNGILPTHMLPDGTVPFLSMVK